MVSHLEVDGVVFFCWENHYCWGMPTGMPCLMDGIPQIEMDSHGTITTTGSKISVFTCFLQLK
jgi:hypothetical protein